MSEHAPRPGSSPGYEKHDVDARKVTVYGLLLILVIIGVGLAVTIAVFQYLGKPQPGDSGSPLLQIPQTLPEPRLQMNPVRDYQEFRAAEEAYLNSYGWIDRLNGVVRIPADRALELVLQRGLPQRPDAAGAAAPAAASVDPKAEPAGSGRKP